MARGVAPSDRRCGLADLPHCCGEAGDHSLEPHRACEVRRATTAGRAAAPGAQGTVRDLERPRKLIQSDDIDGDAVGQPIARLGAETVTMAGRSDEPKGSRIKELGEALTAAAT